MKNFTLVRKRKKHIFPMKRGRANTMGRVNPLGGHLNPLGGHLNPE
jgi:hypothetical protein